MIKIPMRFFRYLFKEIKENTRVLRDVFLGWTLLEILLLILLVSAAVLIIGNRGL